VNLATGHKIGTGKIGCRGGGRQNSRAEPGRRRKRQAFRPARLLVVQEQEQRTCRVAIRLKAPELRPVRCVWARLGALPAAAYGSPPRIRRSSSSRRNSKVARAPSAWMASTWRCRFKRAIAEACGETCGRGGSALSTPRLLICRSSQLFFRNAPPLSPGGGVPILGTGADLSLPVGLGRRQTTSAWTSSRLPRRARRASLARRYPDRSRRPTSWRRALGGALGVGAGGQSPTFGNHDAALSAC
jgi:hypothetical protein